MAKRITTRTVMVVTRRVGVKDRYAGKAGDIIRIGIAPSDAEKAIAAVRGEWPEAVVSYDAVGDTLEVTVPE